MNELKINIPEGYIIDKDNTNLEKGIVKFKKNEITWEDIEKYFPIQTTLAMDVDNSKYFIAYRKLFYIAKYFNASWKPELRDKYINSTAFTIINNPKYYEVCKETGNYYRAGLIYFKTIEDANLAIKLMGDDLKYLF